jgi:site-specific DNA recombinase
MTSLFIQPNIATRTVRAVSYRRVSTESQAEEDKVSLDQQRAMAEREAEARGWKLAADYVDAGISGEKYEERPALQELLRDARARRFDVVIVQNGDRLARKWNVYAQVVEVLENECNIPILDLANPLPVDPLNFEPGRDEIRLFSHGLRSMLASADQRQRTRRLKSAIEERARRGHYLPSTPPFGYREVWQTVPGDKPVRTYEIIPEQFEVVRQMGQWVLVEGMSVRQISNRLRELKIPTAKGGRWGDVIVLNILANPFFGGKTAYKRKQSIPRPSTHKGYAVIKNPRPETVILTDHPLETPWTWSEWEAVQQAILEKRKLPPRSKSSPNPLSGVLRCGDCGLIMAYGVDIKDLKSGIHKVTRTFRCATHSKSKYDCKPHFLPADAVFNSLWGYLDEVARKVKDNPGRFVLEMKATNQEQELAQIEAAEARARNEFDRIARQRATLDERLLDGLELAKYEALSDKLGQDEESARKALLDCEKARRELALREAQSGEMQDFFSFWSEFRQELYTPVLEWKPETLELVRASFQKAFKGIYIKKLGYNRSNRKWSIEIRPEWKLALSFG